MEGESARKSWKRKGIIEGRVMKKKRKREHKRKKRGGGEGGEKEEISW